MNRQRLSRSVIPKDWTWTVLLSLIMVPWGIAAGQPMHDNCPQAIPVELDIPFMGSSARATGSLLSGCSVNDRYDVWHVFTPRSTGYHRISLCGSDFDTTLAVYDACGGTRLACNDDVCWLQSEVIAYLEQGRDYPIRIAGYDRATGNYILVVTEWLDQPVNDTCDQAQEAFLNVPVEGTTIGATGADFSSCADGYDFYDVWYRFTAPAAASYVISLCGSDFDTTLAVFDTCGGLEIACNDDACDSQSQVTVALTEGQSYVIRIAGYDGDVGVYRLSVTEYFEVPQNDTCDTAIPVEKDITYYGTTAGATGAVAGPCGRNDRLDVWHAFVPERSGYHTISLCGSDMDTTLAVYSQCGGQPLACNDDLCDVQSEVVVDLTAGQEYLLRIAANANQTGDYALRITERFDQPANDTCQNAIDVWMDEPYEGTTRDALGDSGTPCGFGFDIYDVWHRFTPPTTDHYLIALCGSTFDTTLAVYDRCSGDVIVCNDDACGGQSMLVTRLMVGQTYLIRIAGYDGQVGNYSLLITGGIAIPAHDQCQGAIPIVADIPYQATTLGATGSDASSCSVDDVYDVWHRFVPTQSGPHIISLCGSLFDTTLSVYEGCGGTELACNDDACEDQSELLLDLVAGVPYLIRIAGYRGGIGDYSILVSEAVCELSQTPDGPMPADAQRDVARDVILAWDLGPLMDHGSPDGRVFVKAIYGADDRRDEYQISNLAWLAAGDATVSLVPLGDLSANGDDTFSLPSTTYAVRHFQDYGWPLCEDEPFRDQPAPAVCSGFLVAPDLVVTTGHCVEDTAECANTAFIFGFVMADADTPTLTVDASQVYFGAEIVARRQEVDSDWALIRLDRPVMDHVPLDLRRTGNVADQQDLFVVGHPLGLPRKYAGGAVVQDNTPTSYFAANLDTYMGSSGSPVINIQTGLVEGLLFGGNVDFVRDGDCERSSVCPDEGCPGWELATRTMEFADRVPSYDVYVGTDPGQMNLVCVDTPKPWCRVAVPLCGQRYYWQVVAKNPCGQTPGPVWSFTTEPHGDLDHDCKVDLTDFTQLASMWTRSDCDLSNDFCTGADLDGQGGVSTEDLMLLVEHWLTIIQD